MLLEKLRAHRTLERLAGEEIRPVTQQTGLSGVCKAAQELCREVEASAGKGGGTRTLDW